MRRFLLIVALAGTVPLTSMAQDDDLYFTPKKESKVEKMAERTPVAERPTYYCGSNRDVDEYNRRGKLKSYYQKVGTDSLGNDVIEFRSGDGRYVSEQDSIAVYPGSETYYDDDDYVCSRLLGMYDDFYGWYDPYFYGYWGRPYWRGWYGLYDPWYYGWYDPWYYGSWYGWGYPHALYGWNGWYGGPAYRSYGGYTGTRNHSGYIAGAGTGSNFGGRRTLGTRPGSFGGRRAVSNGSNRSSNRFGGQRSTYNNNSSRSINSFDNGTFNSSRSSSFGGSRGGGFSGGGSFGGGRSGGFSGGGGGGHFGGRR